MTRATELSAASAIGKAVGISFKGTRFPLATWGQSDDWARLADGTLVCLEVEESQKHPSTNVVKYWPFLEENTSERVLLIQVFFPQSPGRSSSRGRLSRWFGQKMANTFPGRFQRYEIFFRKVGELEGLVELQERLGTSGAHNAA